MAAVLRSSPKMRTSFPRSVRVQWHSLFRSVWLGALAIYIIRLNETDSLHYYLAPSLHPLLLCCPVPLLFISAIMGWQGLFSHKHVHCDCEHPPPSGWIRTSLTYGLVCFPLLLGFLLPDLALGSAMASQKGMALSYAPPEIRRKEPLPEANTMKVQDINGLPSRMDASKASNAAAVGQVQFIPPDEYSQEFADLAQKLYREQIIQVHPAIFSETLGAIDMFQRQFAGKTISLTGFVYRDEGMDQDSHFALGRFLVMCCPADAAPFGIMIHVSNAAAFPTDSWVQIDGSIGSVQVDGKDRLEIRADKVIPVAEPSTPYIYTNADSVEAYDQLQSSDSGQ